MQPGTDLGSAGPQASLVFGAPRRCDLFGYLSLKRESMPHLCVLPLEILFFVMSTLVVHCLLDLQQKLKPFLHSSQEQIAMRSLLGIYSSFVWFRSSFR